MKNMEVRISLKDLVDMLPDDTMLSVSLVDEEAEDGSND